MSVCLLSKYVPIEILGPDFPRSKDQIDNQFLSRVLGASISGHEKKLCEAGQTSSTLIYYNLVYENGSGEGKPSSIAIKIHADAEDVRQMSVRSGLYEREINFYAFFRQHCSSEFLSPEPIAVFRDGPEFFVLVMEDLEAKGWKPLSSFPTTYEDLKSIINSISAPLHAQWVDREDEINEKFGFLVSPKPLEAFENSVSQLPSFYAAWREGFSTSLAFDNVEHFGEKDPNTKLPKSWSNFVDFKQRLIDEDKVSIWMENCNKIYSSRPRSISHGDLNSGNIRYRVKEDGSKEYLFHDFQFIKYSAIGKDFGLIFATVEESITNEGKDLQVMQYSIDTIKKINPSFGYTLEMCRDDFILYIISFLILVDYLMYNQFTQRDKIAPEKFAYAWNVLYPYAYHTAIKAMNRNGMKDLVEKVLDGTYEY